MEQTIKKVTNEEFKKIVDELITQHGFEKAFKLVDHYEIVLPFEPNHCNPAVNEFINRLCVDAEKKEKHILFFGNVRTLSGDNHYSVPKGFEQVWEWNNGYREVYVSKEDLTTITVCEGDLSVVIYHSLAAYEKGYQKSKDFYDNY